MEASHPANALSKAYAIAPTGDMILVVGEKETQLRVHSLCMRTASTVFDAMFGPHFWEGQPSNGGSPKEIPMPDDDAKAMIFICNVIHHRNDTLPDVLQPAELADIAVAADKYDCLLTLKFAMNQRLDWEELVTFSSLGSLLIAAYVFDNSNAFKRVTRRLVTGFSDPYHWLIKEDSDSIVPWSIYYSLERARTRTRVRMQDAVLAEMVDCCNHPSKEAYAHITAPELFHLYNDFWGDSLFKMSIDDAIEKVKEMVHPGSRLDHGGPWPCPYDQQQALETCYSKLNHLRAFAGLCLRCVRSGNTDAVFPCKLNH